MYNVIRTGDPLLVYNVDEDMGKAGRGLKTRSYGSKSFICVPMKLRDRVIGVLNVTDKHRGDVFDSFDLRVLSTVANQVAETYENVLLQKKSYERERLEKELEIAAEIQGRTLSVVPDSIHGVSAGAFTIPSSYVGGDFFEFSPFSDDSFGVAVGDVSGKGIPAAIFMNSVRYALRFELLRHREPADLMGRLNNWVYKESFSGMFCTFFYAFVDAKARTVSYASGGHNEQLFYRRVRRRVYNPEEKRKAAGNTGKRPLRRGRRGIPARRLPCSLYRRSRGTGGRRADGPERIHEHHPPQQGQERPGNRRITGGHGGSSPAGERGKGRFNPGPGEVRVIRGQLKARLANRVVAAL